MLFLYLATSLSLSSYTIAEGEKRMKNPDKQADEKPENFSHTTEAMNLLVVHTHQQIQKKARKQDDPNRSFSSKMNLEKKKRKESTKKKQKRATSLNLSTRAEVK
jgi:hypothetical protein